MIMKKPFVVLAMNLLTSQEQEQKRNALLTYTSKNTASFPTTIDVIRVLSDK